MKILKYQNILFVNNVNLKKIMKRKEEKIKEIKQNSKVKFKNELQNKIQKHEFMKKIIMNFKVFFTLMKFHKGIKKVF